MLKHKVLFLCAGNSYRSQMKAHHSFPDPAKTNKLEDFRQVRVVIKREINSILEDYAN